MLNNETNLIGLAYLETRRFWTHVDYYDYEDTIYE